MRHSQARLGVDACVGDSEIGSSNGQANVRAMRASARLLAQNDQNNQHNDPTGHRDIQPGHACNPRYRLKSDCSIQLVLAATCASAGFRPTFPQSTSHRSSQPLDPWEPRRCTKPCSYQTATLPPRPRAERKSKSAKNSHQFPVPEETNALRSHGIVAPVDRHFDLMRARELL